MAGSRGGIVGVVVVTFISAGVPAGMGKPGKAAGHSFATPLGFGGEHDGVRGAPVGGVNQGARPRRRRRCCGPSRGGHDERDYAPTSLWAGAASRSDRLTGAQRAHVMVAQGVEDEFQLPAGRGHDSDVVSTPLLDPVTELP